MGGSKMNISTATPAAHGCSLGLLLLLLSVAVGTVQCRHNWAPTPPGLSEDFYAESCPELFDIVTDGVLNASQSNLRIFASFLRLSFHDCWIGGCDGSLFLNDNATAGTTELNAVPNFFIKGLPEFDVIKAEVEEICPKTVSCADLVTIVARDSVALAGGLPWPVVLGRRDSLTSHFTQAMSSLSDGLPNPFDSLEGTIKNFNFRNFSFDEMITLSGAHTFGRARCPLFLLRASLNNDTDINPILNATLQKFCAVPDNVTEVVNLDQTTPDVFDNKYYSNLKKEFGILHTDQNLFSAQGANKLLVDAFSQKNELFLIEFAEAMIKMQNLGPLTGTDGEIRVQCSKVNSPNRSRTSSKSSIAIA